MSERERKQFLQEFDETQKISKIKIICFKNMGWLMVQAMNLKLSHCPKDIGRRKLQFNMKPGFAIKKEAKSAMWNNDNDQNDDAFYALDAISEELLDMENILNIF